GAGGDGPHGAGLGAKAGERGVTGAGARRRQQRDRPIVPDRAVSLRSTQAEPSRTRRTVAASGGRRAAPKAASSVRRHKAKGESASPPSASSALSGGVPFRTLEAADGGRRQQPLLLLDLRAFLPQRLFQFRFGRQMQPVPGGEDLLAVRQQRVADHRLA